MRNSIRPVEKALIARLLLEPDQVANTSGLMPEHFVQEGLGQVYAHIISRYRDGKTFDSITIQSDTGIEVDVMGLPPAAFGPVEEYCDKIKDASLRRELVKALDTARGRIEGTEDDPLEVIGSTLDRITHASKATGLRNAAEVIKSYSNEFRGRRAGTGGIPYGIPVLDRTLLPMRAGRLVVIASRPGVGKTALAESISDAAARHAPVLFVSLEMGAEELTDRAMARASGLPANKIMRGDVDLEKLDDHLKARADLPIIYLDDGMTTTDKISTAISQADMQGQKVGLVIVDYLQLVADKQGGDNEVTRVSNIAHSLKRIALKHKVPVLALAQLNRRIENDARAPRLSDLRESGAIEQDADVVCIITGDPADNKRDLFILKNRQGHPGRVNLDFDGDSQTWSERGAKEEW